MTDALSKDTQATSSWHVSFPATDTSQSSKISQVGSHRVSLLDKMVSSLGKPAARMASLIDSIFLRFQSKEGTTPASPAAISHPTTSKEKIQESVEKVGLASECAKVDLLNDKQKIALALKIAEKMRTDPEYFDKLMKNESFVKLLDWCCNEKVRAPEMFRFLVDYHKYKNNPSSTTCRILYRNSIDPGYETKSGAESNSSINLSSDGQTKVKKDFGHLIRDYDTNKATIDAQLDKMYQAQVQLLRRNIR